MLSSRNNNDRTRRRCNNCHSPESKEPSTLQQIVLHQFFVFAKSVDRLSKLFRPSWQGHKKVKDVPYFSTTLNCRPYSTAPNAIGRPMAKMGGEFSFNCGYHRFKLPAFIAVVVVPFLSAHAYKTELGILCWSIIDKCSLHYWRTEKDSFSEAESSFVAPRRDVYCLAVVSLSVFATYSYSYYARLRLCGKKTWRPCTMLSRSVSVS